jgi:hypothetical protein
VRKSADQPIFLKEKSRSYDDVKTKDDDKEQDSNTSGLEH